MMVRVNDWQNPRHLFIFDGRVVFEVAAVGHCDICQSRIDRVQSAIKVKNLPARTFEDRIRPEGYGADGERGFFVEFPAPPRDQDILAYVGEMLDLRLVRM